MAGNSNRVSREVSDDETLDDGAIYSGDSASSTDDLVVDSESEELSLIDIVDEDETPCNSMSAKARERLKTKKRLDAYLERQLLKESGWDDDDELFDDEFFKESSFHRA